MSASLQAGPEALPRAAAPRAMPAGVLWAGLPYLAAFLVAAPVLFVLASLFAPLGAAQDHIWATTGPLYVRGTLVLCLLVGAGASLLGAGAAILVALTEFPGRRLLSPLLALPFAVPAYIMAYAYADLLGPFGGVARAFGGEVAAGLNLRSLPGAAFILILSVYPYIYLAMRASLAARSDAFLEAARLLGAGPWRATARALLPAGRAAFAGGLALALMETAAEFGVADYLGVSTLSVGIFRTWYGLGDLAAASQLAAALLLIALLLSVGERASRRGLGAEAPRAMRGRTRIRLKGAAAFLALLFCAAPVALGFLAPTLVLLGKLAAPATLSASRGLVTAAANTALVAGLGAALAMGLATLLAFRDRQGRSLAGAAATRVATLGYAAPGPVLAIGVLGVAALLRELSGVMAAGLVLLLYAYVARFLAAGYAAAHGGLAQIHPATDGAARVLGAGPSRILARLHLPLARSALGAGFFIVLIDIAKELPATMLLRPFNFDTLATRVHRLAADERLADAAPAALVLIAISLAPALLLDRLGGKR